MGVPPQDKPQIFAKGFGRDSGLGLFLIREILSITKISIQETGDYGKGARFEMLIPKEMYRIAKDSHRDRCHILTNDTITVPTPD